MPATKSQTLQIRKWTEGCAKTGQPFPLISETMAELPVGVDAGREAAKARALVITRGRKVRSCLSLSGGGFTVAVEL